MSIMSRVLTNIQANQAAMRVICRAGEIAQKMQNYTCSKAAENVARKRIEAAAAKGGRTSGNARFVRNFISSVKERMAMRVMSDGVATKGELQRIEADAMVQVGLASDIEPITNMMVKLALVELARGTNSGISALADELTFDYYMWANRRERRHRNWSPFPNGGNRPTILRWYGANIEKAVDCALCGTAGIALDDGADIEAQLVDLNCD